METALTGCNAADRMRATLEAIPSHDPDAPTILVEGETASIKVQHGHLLIEDGSKQHPRSVRLVRAYSQDKRIVILAWHGIITLDALQWCRALDIEMVAFDTCGEQIIMHSGQHVDTPQLRRAQALASDQPIGLEIIRYLLGMKLTGQAGFLASLPNGEARTMSTRPRSFGQALSRETLLEAQSIEECRGIEAEVAGEYWQRWSSLPMRWSGQVPEHWKTAGPRRYGKTYRTRKTMNAVSPAHAILNYCYRLAEIETIIALRRCGLDSGIGILHSDQPNRHSMALDCLEAIRPAIDTYVAGLLANRVFGVRDVCELETGVCRVLPPLSHELTSTMPRWRSKIAPVVEHIAWMLQHPDWRGEKPKKTPLSRANMKQQRRKSQAVIRCEHNPVGRSCKKCRYQERHEEWNTVLYPNVRTIPTSHLASATGLASSYLRKIKLGLHVPAREHWSAFEKAILERNGSAK